MNIFKRSLLDSRACVKFNLKFGSQEPIMIELTIRWIHREPHGKLEDFIVKVEKCQLSIDFFVVDLKILGNLSHAPSF